MVSPLKLMMIKSPLFRLLSRYIWLLEREATSGDGLFSCDRWIELIYVGVWYHLPEEVIRCGYFKIANKILPVRLRVKDVQGLW